VVNSATFSLDRIRILITGVTSIHGWPIYKKMMAAMPPSCVLAVASPKIKARLGANVWPMCITDRQGLSEIAVSFNPTHVIHCGGVCDLDVCEARPGWAHRMNAGAARAIADIFGAHCHITYASSDLVFSGLKTPVGGYDEQCGPDPVSVVGRTYVEAENEILRSPRTCIVRLGLPLGDSVTGDKGPVDWIDSRFRRRLPVTLFYDEVRSCISCDDLAEKVLMLSLSRAQGLFHCGGPKSMSLYDIGLMVRESGNYSAGLLKRASRLDDIGGPPRVGDVSLNSLKLDRVIRTFPPVGSGALPHLAENPC
jgi:dTDP-4-dehydrorhamnose reductase